MTGMMDRSSLASAWRSKGADLFICTPGVVRVLLATAVLISHMSAYDIGRLGVIMFFFLSGYWTSRIWTEKFEEKQFLRFYLARALRIYPLFLTISIARHLILDMPLVPENIFLFGTASMVTNGPPDVSWSLDIEMQYYLLCPLILPALRRYPALTVMLALSVAAYAWSIVTAFHVRTAFLYLPAFLLGAWCDQSKWIPSLRDAYLSLFAFLATTAFTYFTPFLTKGTKDPFNQDIYAFFWMLPLIPYLLRSLAMKSSRFDRKFGEYSYALYLAHFPIVSVLVINGTIEEKLIAAVVSYFVAALLFLSVDDPINRLRYRMVDNFRKARPAHAA